MKIDTETVFNITLLLMLIVFLIAILLVGVDSTTVKAIGTKNTTCIDHNGNKFVDEICEEEIYCSWLGLITAKKCGDVEK